MIKSPTLSVDDLIQEVLHGHYDVSPESLHVVGAFWISQSTQFPGTEQKYRNYYLLLRVETSFGGCCVEVSQLSPEVAQEVSGKNLVELLDSQSLPIRIAALDAYFGFIFPHQESTLSSRFELPSGTPLERAIARDEAIVSLLDIQPEQKVGLIGVVNPLVAAIKKQGGVCMPCDFNMSMTQDGLAVTQDMKPLLEKADYLIVTGMTLSNGTFDTILSAARKRNIPLVFFAQTGSNIIPRFLSHGVSAVCAEPFPFSQFSAIPTPLYLYRAEEKVE